MDNDEETFGGKVSVLSGDVRQILPLVVRGTPAQTIVKPHVIHATIMTDERQGQHVLISRIAFISDGDSRECPFRLRRKQFPNLGLNLSTPCFSHSQMYVALSRVTSRSKFKALIEYPQLEEEDGVYIDNIVYRQIVE
ncbi:hypothetical protein PC120_g15164 [Phytophthora cactorum]|nr:hypothetical protein PC120_g15164 [Phytophthora cactorum]